MADHITAAQRFEELLADLANLEAERGPNATMSTVTAAHMLRDLAGCAAADRRSAFDEGMQLGARVEHQRAVRAIAVAALDVLGQDKGDGPTDLGRLGTWVAPREADALKL